MLSILLCFILLPESGNTVFAKENKDNIQTFISETIGLINYEPELTFTTDSVSENDEKSSVNFSSCRLIIQSSKKPDDLNCVGMASGFKDYYIVQFRNKFDAETAFNIYKETDYIKSVSPDVQCISLNEENQTDIKEQLNITDSRLNSWGSDGVGLYDLKDYIINNNIQLNDIVVGVVDGGVELEHEFFKDRLIRTYFTSDENDPDGTEESDFYHGTNVTSIIIDSTPENVKVANYQISNDEYVNYSSAVAAILQAAADNVDVINASWSFYFMGAVMYPEQEAGMNLLKDAINYTVEKGIIFVAAAGNNHEELDYFEAYPAVFDSVITVAATDKYRMPAFFTSYGAQSIDIAAPGLDLPIAEPDNTYVIGSGTSYAAPITVSVCAMIKAFDPAVTPEDVKQRLKESAAKFSPKLTFTKIYGPGIIDAPCAVGLQKGHVIKADKTPGNYEDEITIELLSRYNETIYYTLDGSYPTSRNGILYTEPVNIYDEAVTLNAVAYNADGLPGELFSELYRSSIIGDENDFTIDTDGTVLSYTGNLHEITVPQTIHGITVTQMGQNVFNDREVFGVILPDTVTLLFSTFYDNDIIEYVSGKNVTEIKMAFGSAENISEVDFPNLETIGSSSFYVTYRFLSASFPKVKVVGNKAFCGSNIKYLELPECESLESEVFYHCDLYELFAPKVTEYNKGKLSNILHGPLFDCRCSKPIAFPFLKEINFHKGSDYEMHPKEIMQIEFSSLEKMKELPHGAMFTAQSRLALPSTLQDIDVTFNSSNRQESSYIIYGSVGTYAQSWAEENGVQFVEITPQTAVIEDVEPYYKEYMKEIDVNIIGFNKTYQWYANTSAVNSGGIPIEGADKSKFNPETFQAPYYYCVVTSQDTGYDPVIITSSVCENRDYKEITSADNSVIIDYRNNYIYGISSNETSLDSIIHTSYGSSISYEKIVTGEAAVTSSGNEFTLIVLGDLNGDGCSDGRDAVLLSCVQNGLIPENDLNFFACDVNSDYRLDDNDYELVVESGVLKILNQTSEKIL